MDKAEAMLCAVVAGNERTKATQLKELAKDADAASTQEATDKVQGNDDTAQQEEPLWRFEECAPCLRDIEGLSTQDPVVERG